MGEDGQPLLWEIEDLSELGVLCFTFGRLGASSFIFYYAQVGLEELVIFFVILNTQDTT